MIVLFSFTLFIKTHYKLYQVIFIGKFNNEYEYDKYIMTFIYHRIVHIIVMLYYIQFEFNKRKMYIFYYYCEITNGG